MEFGREDFVATLWEPHWQGSSTLKMKVIGKYPLDHGWEPLMKGS